MTKNKKIISEINKTNKSYNKLLEQSDFYVQSHKNEKSKNEEKLK